ncbi:MAG: polysaccharide pyruvyl transferase family protein [Coleofasciculus sp. G1-WW12-02]|uniref:polysaccharide pyruvyl transferase family protein n=1 Tax=Coleofasciculus sp. G1-WW12-02 TaxID=3068483 RepID=UPI0032FC5E19
MKLYYHKLPNTMKNFGDNLNPWLWNQLLHGILDEDPTTAFIGIGSLINDNLPLRTKKARKRVVFGTGVGYGKGIPKIDSFYKIYCLRGLLSARVLGVSEKLAITDPAVLIRKVFHAKNSKLHRFAYMPHHQLAGKGWELVCRELGFSYIDPGGSVDNVLSCLARTEILLTEAMHGAIVADALRIPWIPIITSPTILPFKWQDWCSSIGLEYRPVYLDRLHHPRNRKDILLPVRVTRNWLRQKTSAAQLLKAAKNSSPLLSEDTCIERLATQLDERLEQFKADVFSGLFS